MESVLGEGVRREAQGAGWTVEGWNGGQGPGGPSVVSCQLSVVSSMAAGKARKARKGTAEGKRLRLKSSIGLIRFIGSIGSVGSKRVESARQRA